MKGMFVFAVFVVACATWLFPGRTAAAASKRNTAPRGSRIPVGNAELYAREIGRGKAIIVLHGGPDFDHSYLLPEMDRLPIPTTLSITTSGVVAGPPMV